MKSLDLGEIAPAHAPRPHPDYIHDSLHLTSRRLPKDRPPGGRCPGQGRTLSHVGVVVVTGPQQVRGVSRFQHSELSPHIYSEALPRSLSTLFVIRVQRRKTRKLRCM